MNLNDICSQLEENYGERGATAAGNLRDWCSGEVPMAFPEILEQHFEASHLDLLFDAFRQYLPFGTGGRRGPVGYGPNRMNPTTVSMTVQGHCAYLKKAFAGDDPIRVVVANDVRMFKDISGRYGFLGEGHPLLGESSRSFGQLACEIYAANGIVSYVEDPDNDQGLMTTPMLSFVIRRLEARGGVNLSASHNPPDDNGLKVYDEDGSQPVAPNDQMLIDTMKEAKDIKTMPFAEAREQGLILPVPPEIRDEYLDIYLRHYDNIVTATPDHPIVYTPLCGCGESTIGLALNALNFPIRVPEDQKADGGFSVIPFKSPNPEVAQATAPAKAYADEVGSGIVLSSDPDADRVGLDVKLNDGTWQHFDGNQIATILCYYLMRDPDGPQRKGLVIETIVTTRLLGEIVNRTEDSQIVDDLLVGFKYVADVLKTLETGKDYKGVRCAPDDLVLAAEESHGVLMTPDIRDKDATPACIYLAALLM
ncbi:MAG: hypothetical protein AAF492_07070 [Verrucomicrobiota bacterium]